MTVSCSFLLDSSVIVKWFRDEVDSEKALAIQAQFIKGTLDIQIGELTFFETANALRCSGDYSTDEVCDCLDSIVDLGVSAYPFDFDVLKSAVGGSFVGGTSIYDAYLIALAKTYGLSLVTADENLFTRVGGDASVLLLSAWPASP